MGKYGQELISFRYYDDTGRYYDVTGIQYAASPGRRKPSDFQRVLEELGLGASGHNQVGAVALGEILTQNDGDPERKRGIKDKLKLA